MEMDNSPPVRRTARSPQQSRTRQRDDRADLAGVLHQLVGRQDRVARAIADAVRSEVKEYGAFETPEQFEVVVADTRHHLETFARWAPSGRMPDVVELQFIAELARDRAAAGFPLEAMLHAFRVGHRVLWDWLIDRVQEPGKGEIALALTPFMHEYLGVVTRRLTEAYVEAVHTSDADAAQSRRDLFEALLRGDAPERTLALAQALGLQADAQYVVMVATFGPSERVSTNELLRRAAEILRRRLREAGVDAFPIRREDELVLLLPWATDHRRTLHAAVEPAAESLTQMYGARLVAGAGMACDGLAAIRLGYQEARLALQRASATGRFVALADATLFDSLLALGAPAVERRLPTWARELAAEQNDLVETLLAYLAADMSIERAAHALTVHPNTVRYRLRRLSKLTGLNASSFYDLVELVTATRLLPDVA